jgi:hypothetical protein
MLNPSLRAVRLGAPYGFAGPVRSGISTLCGASRACSTSAFMPDGKRLGGLDVAVGVTPWHRQSRG